MKKLIIPLLLMGVLLLAGIGYLLYTGLNPQTADATAPGASSDATNQPSQSGGPTLGILKEKDTDADILEALDYEIGKNKDTVAWLKIPNTNINNSVVQSHNNLYYLRLNERKESDIYGCYFADYECSIGSRDLLSANTVIYGHSDLKDNPDGPRFSQLFRYTDQTFAENNPYIYLTTQEELLTWEVFAAFYTDIKLDYIRTNLSGQERTELAKQAEQLSVYDYGITVSPNDKLLTLSTCSVKYGTEGDKRFVVMARLIPEDSKVQTQKSLKKNDAAT